MVQSFLLEKIEAKSSHKCSRGEHMALSHKSLQLTEKKSSYYNYAILFTAFLFSRYSSLELDIKAAKLKESLKKLFKAF